jgi:hypothetical protein
MRTEDYEPSAEAPEAPVTPAETEDEPAVDEPDEGGDQGPAEAPAEPVGEPPAPAQDQPDEQDAPGVGA